MLSHTSCEDWIKNMDTTVTFYDLSSVVLIGHSLGCSTIAHWSARYKRNIKGAMLVAPSDLEGINYNFPTRGFSPIPLDRLYFNSIVVASSNDIWVSLERTKFFAKNWDSSTL
jgi:predicted alpha/beta hydrolase family esterase